MDRDEAIKQKVADAMVEADKSDDNWVDHLPDYVSCEARYAKDSWYIGTLPDNRTIWLAHEDMEGSDRYEIIDAE